MLFELVLLFGVLAATPVCGLYNTPMQLSPVTGYGSSSNLQASLTQLFSPIDAAVTVDASAGSITVIATSENPPGAFFSSSILTGVADAATSAGFSGTYSSAVLGTGCGFTGAAPSVAGPNDTLPGTLDCTNSLGVALVTQGQPPAEAIVSAVCKTLGYTDCSVIVASIVNDDAAVIITTKDPIAALVGLRAALMTPSYMTMLRIVKMSVQSTVVYLQQTVEVEHIQGDVGSCAERLWYLTFLILLLPIFYVSSRFLYKRGAAKGKLKALTEHEKTRKSEVEALRLRNQLEEQNQRMMMQIFANQQHMRQ